MTTQEPLIAIAKELGWLDLQLNLSVPSRHIGKHPNLKATTIAFPINVMTNGDYIDKISERRFLTIRTTSTPFKKRSRL